MSTTVPHPLPTDLLMLAPLTNSGVLMVTEPHSVRRVGAAFHLRFARARKWLALALLSLVVLGLFASPVAATAETSDVSWNMRPATDGAPDERSWMELDLGPGEKAEEQAALTNLGAETVTFRITAADGYFTSSGRFNMLPSSETSRGAGTWIDVADEVTVQPGATAIVPFTVAVPENAEPGDHAAGIAASITSVGNSPNEASLGVESRIGFRVMTRVKGDISPSVTIENVRSGYLLSWNPLHLGSVTLDAEVVNTGNARVLLDGTASAQRGSVPLIPEGGSTQELLPGDRRTVTTVIDNVWPIFVVPVGLSVSPTVVNPANDEIRIPPAEWSSVVVAVPVPQLLILLGFSLILVALLAGRIRSRRRLHTLVQQAREEGLREATRASHRNAQGRT